MIARWRGVRCFGGAADRHQEVRRSAAAIIIARSRRCGGEQQVQYCEKIASIQTLRQALINQLIQSPPNSHGCFPHTTKRAHPHSHASCVCVCVCAPYK